MIVVCGIPSEPPVRLLLEAAHLAGVEAAMLNQRDSGRTALCLEARGTGTPKLVYHGPDGSIDLSAAHGIFVRLMEASNLPEYELSGASRIDRCRIDAWHAILGAWTETAQCRVMNRLKPSNSNVSKPYQAQLIARAGLPTPATIVTNDPAEVLAFRRKHGRIIFKSISARRSIVRELGAGDMRRLERIRQLPTQFQELLEGEDIRVHVVGDALFATHIESDVVDYRYASDQGGAATYEATNLPADVAEKCRWLSRSLQLPLCGIDLKRDRTGAYYCLEVNPSPAYSSFEEHTGQPIAAAIVRYLERG
jgi:hypothetical protein